MGRWVDGSGMMGGDAVKRPADSRRHPVLAHRRRRYALQSQWPSGRLPAGRGGTCSAPGQAEASRNAALDPFCKGHYDYCERPEMDQCDLGDFGYTDFLVYADMLGGMWAISAILALVPLLLYALAGIDSAGNSAPGTVDATDVTHGTDSNARGINDRRSPTPRKQTAKAKGGRYRN